LQLSGTLLVLLLRPDVAFVDGNPLRLSVEGEYVVKNLVLLAATASLALHSLGTPPAAPPRRLAAARDPDSETRPRRQHDVRPVGRLAPTQEVTDLNPPRSWAVRGVDGPFRPSADITVEPLDDGTRSRVTFALDFQGRGIAKLLTLDVIRRITLKQAPRSYRNLKERLERGDRRALGSAGATRPRKRRAV
jgi:Polyketide cyclase / dehydrase and lipid transport